MSKQEVAEEAQSIAELLPLFLKHEMQIDSSFYCLPDLEKAAMGGQYNPITRIGYLGKFLNTIRDEESVSKKAHLPEFCQEFEAEELVKVFRCSYLFPNLQQAADDDLASLAGSIASYAPLRKKPENLILGINKLLEDYTLKYHGCYLIRFVALCWI